MMGETHLVTALIITYNHARYVGTAIESALNQQTGFPVEILISEDASTDGTREIVQRYAADFPKRITAIYSDNNVRSNRVVARGLSRARGRYISMLDGDDQWTSKTKLRDQASYLETHSNVSAVFHNALVADEEEVSSRRWTRQDEKSILSLEDIWQGNPFATCTGMMRSECVRNIPDWYDGFFPITDWPLYVVCAKQGNLAFIDEVVGVYRLHGEGRFSALEERSKHDMVEKFYRRMIEVLDAPDAVAARNGCSRYFFDWAKKYLEAGNAAGAWDCLRRSRRAAIGRSFPTKKMFFTGLQILKTMAVKR